MKQDSSLPEREGSLFLSIVYAGVPKHVDLETQRKILMLNIIILVGGLLTFLLGILALVRNNMYLGTADLLVTAFLCGLLWDLRTGKHYARDAWLGTVVMGIFYFYLVLTGGVENTAFLWLLTYPNVSIFLLGRHRGTVISMTFIVVVGLVLAFRDILAIPAEYSNAILIRFLAVYVANHLISYAMEKMRYLVQDKMEAANHELDTLNKDHQQVIEKLKKTIEEVRTLQGILPICSSCKKIRNDQGYWEQVEEYVRDHTHAQFTHGLCPECKNEIMKSMELNQTK